MYFFTIIALLMMPIHLFCSMSQFGEDQECPNSPISLNALIANQETSSPKFNTNLTLSPRTDQRLRSRRVTLIEKGHRLITGKKFTLYGIGLFKGRDIFSHLICTATNSEFSHCAVILRDINATTTDIDDALYCYEATGSAEEVMQKNLPQVQITSWLDVKNHYHGKVKLRCFEFAEGQSPDPDLITKFVQNHLGTPYPHGIAVLLHAINRRNEAENLNSLFCSELVALILVENGYIVHDKRLVNNYLPRDFAYKSMIEWQKGAKLGVEQDIKKTLEHSPRSPLISPSSLSLYQKPNSPRSSKNVSFEDLQVVASLTHSSTKTPNIAATLEQPLPRKKHTSKSQKIMNRSCSIQ